jgi:hypothetical protein
VVHRVVHLLREVLQPRDVVVVVLDRVEGEVIDELRRLDLDAVVLSDRHLPAPELRALEPLLELPDHQRLVELLLLREARRVDGLETLQELGRLGEVLFDGGERVVARLVVPSLVAEDRRELGIGRERVFPLLGEQVVQRFPAARARGFGPDRGGRDERRRHG